MGWMSLFSKRARYNEWREDAEKAIRFLSALGPEELCVARINAAMGFRYTASLIERLPNSSQFWPALEALDDPGRRLTKIEDGHLSQLIIGLLQSNKELSKENALPQNGLGSGLITVVVSLRAVARPELFDTGRTLWRELDRADPERYEELAWGWIGLCEGTPMARFCLQETAHWFPTPAAFTPR